MFSKVKRTVSNEYSGSFSFTRGLWADIRRAREDPTPPVAEEDDESVSERRFRTRYENARRQALVHLLMLSGIAAWTAWLLSESGTGLMLSSCIIATCLLGGLYLKAAFRLWVGRVLLRRWPDHPRRTFLWGDYIGAVADDWRELLPLRAPRSKPRLSAPKRKKNKGGVTNGC